MADLIRVDQIEVVGLTRKNEAAGFDVTPHFDLFGKIPEKYRTVLPGGNAETINRRYLFEIRSAPLGKVDSVTLELSIKGSLQDKLIEYHKKLMPHKNHHRYFWFLRDG